RRPTRRLVPESGARGLRAAVRAAELPLVGVRRYVGDACMRLALAPLAQREFRLMFLGRVSSYAGSTFAIVALPFAVLELITASGRGGRHGVLLSWLWVIVVAFAFLNATEVGGVNVLGPVVAERSLGGPASWGLIVTAESVGLIAAGFVMLRWRPSRILLVGALGVLGGA